MRHSQIWALLTLAALVGMSVLILANRRSAPAAALEAAPTAAAPLRAVTALPALVPTEVPTATAEVTPSNDETILVATGDVMLGRMVRTQAEARSGYRWPFEGTRDLLAGADITLINLESPIYEPCPISTMGLLFCSPEESVEGLVFAGVDVANIANNHILDRDQAGYDSTVRLLNEAGIRPSDSHKFAIIERQSVRFGFVGFNRIQQFPDTPILSTDDMLTSIEEHARQVDVLVVSLHWGEEFRTQPNQARRSLAYQAIEHGADVIVGTHPHVVQPAELYQGKLILYSLGNFVFDDMSALATRQGQVAVLRFVRDELVSYELVPITIHDYGQPRVDGTGQTLTP